MEFDALTPTSTRIRITGVTSPEMAAHVESLLGTSAHQYEFQRAATQAELRQEVVTSPLGHLVIKPAAGSPEGRAADEPIGPEAPDQGTMVRAACFRCACQDFQPGPEHDRCAVCGHLGSTSHTVLCPPAIPSAVRDWAGVALRPGLLLIVGGTDGGSATEASWRFHASSGWSRAHDLPEPRVGGQLVAMTPASAILVGSVEANGMPDGRTYIWEQEQGWRPGPDMPQRISAVGATVTADGSVVAAGGLDGERTPTDATFVLSGGLWAVFARLPQPRSGISLAVSPNAELYALGGCGATFETASVFTYDAPTAAWVDHSRMPIPVTKAVSVFVENSGQTVLGVAGGTNQADPFGESTSMVYAPASSKWMQFDPAYGRLRPARYGRRLIQRGLLAYMVR